MRLIANAQLKRLLAILVFAGCATGAQAQFRAIPEEAERGEMRHLQGMLVEIDGKRQQLAPGAQIRGANNLLVLPAALPPGSLVKYLMGDDGMVRRVWILTPEEAAQPDKRK